MTDKYAYIILNLMSENASALEQIIHRYFYYRKYYHFTLALVIFLAINVLSLAGLLIYQKIMQPTARYFPTTPDARLIDMPVLTDRYVSDRSVVQWIKKATIVLYSLDFVNYRRTLQEARHYFTASGYQHFIEAFDKSNNLTAIQEKKQIVTVKILEEPIIFQQKLYGSQEKRYGWQLRFRVELKYENSAKEVSTQKLLATAFIIRVPTLESAPLGIAIHQFIMEQIT